MIKFLDLRKQYEMIRKEIDAAIKEVILNSAFVGGKYVRRFEEEFCKYLEVAHCVGVGNGTDALEIAIQSLDMPSGSQIIVPANSFAATAEAVVNSGHQVVFCDCEESNHTISIRSFQEHITSKTKAVIAVHLYGHPCNMDELLHVAKKHGLRVIEDCAQAHGAMYKNRKVGTFGDVGAFSFYPGKNLGAYGDAGAIVTNDEMLAKKCKMIANHGRTAKYDHEFVGRNSRLDGMQAAILSVKLRHLDDWIKTRNELAEVYLKGLQGMPGIVVPKRAEWARHVYHLFVIRAKRRDELRSFLQQNRIETGIHYPLSLPKLRAFEHCRQGRDRMFANVVDKELLSLPIGEHLDCNDIREVVDSIRSFWT